MLAKATGSVPHTGGKLFEKDSESYRKLLRWIEQAAEFDGETAPRLVSVSLDPKDVVLEGHRSKHPVTVTGSYSDGMKRDVTDLATFSSNNANVATISQEGQIVADRPGDCLLYTSPSPRDQRGSRMPSSA